MDIDIKLDPEPKGIFASIASLKESLKVSVELASPDQFVPALPGWVQRSEFITRSGQVEFFHYDFYGQAFAKIVRGHQVDLSDAHNLILLGKVKISLLNSLIQSVMPDLERYPALNPSDVQARIDTFFAAEEAYDH